MELHLGMKWRIQIWEELEALYGSAVQRIELKFWLGISSHYMLTQECAHIPNILVCSPPPPPQSPFSTQIKLTVESNLGEKDRILFTWK